MPDSVFSQAQTDAIEKGYFEDYLNDYPFFDMVTRSGGVRKKAGDRLTVDYATNPPDVYSYGRDSTVQATQKGEMIRGYFDWGAIAMDTKEYGWDIENQGAEGQISSGTLRKLMAHRIDLIKSPFFRRLNERLWQGASVAYNGGDGIDFYGVENQVTTAPSSATHGGLSLSTYDELQSQQISGTAGPSSDWEADAWERLLTLKVNCHHPSKWGEKARPDFCFTTRASYVDIIQLAYNQNTNVGLSVDDLETVGGIMPQINDAQDANTVFLLASRTWRFYYPKGRRNVVEIDVRSELEDRMNPMDTVAIITCKGNLICEFLPQNGMITNAG